MNVYLGYIFILVAAICWGFLGVLGRMAMAAGLGPFDVAFWRAFFGGSFLLIHAFCIKDIYVRSAKHLGVFVLFGIFSIASFFVAYQYAVKDGGVALASVLLYTAPAWVALFSRIFFNIAFTKVTAIAIVIAMIGVACISFSGTSATANQENTLPILGIIFGLLSGFLYATHYVVTKKFLTIYTPFTLYGYGSMVAAACIFPFTQLYLYNDIFIWLILFGLGFISTYVAYWAYCEGIRRLNPTKAAIIANFEPVVATLAAWYIWGENFSAWGWFGAVLILCTVFILLVDDRKRA